MAMIVKRVATCRKCRHDTRIKDVCSLPGMQFKTTKRIMEFQEAVLGLFGPGTNIDKFE